MDLQSFKTQFDDKLNKYLKGKINQSKDIVQNGRLASILEHIHTITFAGGKRIRPYCFFMWYSIYNANPTEELRQFALTFELLHTMALIHDDIIDEADKRHNVATIHHFIKENNPNIQRRIAEWQAILAGDLLLARVYDIMMQPYQNPNHLQATQTVHTMIQETILGQMIDVDLTIGEATTMEILERKNRYKTARYTFARPLVAGAQRAGAPQEQIDILRNIGETLWLAYQLRDDLIDILETETDKPTFYDIQEWQQTLLTQYIYNYGTQADKELLTACLGKQINEEQIKQLKDMFHSSWAIDFAQKKIAAYIKDATAVLTQITFQNTETKDYLTNLIQRLTKM